MNETDEQLVEAYRKGDEHAFARLTERYTKSIYRYVSRLSNSGEEANDIVQDTFVKAWKKLWQFDTKKSFRAWLFAIAYHTLIDWSRKKKEVLFSKLETDTFRFEDTIVDMEPLPESVFLQKELSEHLNQTLEKLPKNYQNVVLLHLQNDLTFAEIATLLKKPLNTVKSHYRRAVALLRTELLEVHQNEQ